jgi:hypothetical protein
LQTDYRTMNIVIKLLHVGDSKTLTTSETTNTRILMSRVTVLKAKSYSVDYYYPCLKTILGRQGHDAYSI